MQEILITFETAELAKQKGFNIRTDFKFDRNNKIDKTPSLKYQMRNGTNILINPSPFTFAPTQSLLQKWLREIYSIDIILFRYGQIVYRCHIYKNGLLEEVFGLEPNYELLLENGLQKGLKLIPETT